MVHRFLDNNPAIGKLSVVTLQKDKDGFVHYPGPLDTWINEWKKLPASHKLKLDDDHAINPAIDPNEAPKSGPLLTAWYRNLFGKNGHGFSTRDNIYPCKNTGSVDLQKGDLVEITGYDESEFLLNVQRPTKLNNSGVAVLFSDYLPTNAYGLVMLNGYEVVQFSSTTNLSIGRGVGSLNGNVQAGLGGIGAGVVLGVEGTRALIGIGRQPLHISDINNQVDSPWTLVGANWSDITLGRNKYTLDSGNDPFAFRHDFIAVIPVSNDQNAPEHKQGLNLTPIHAGDGSSHDSRAPNIARMGGAGEGTATSPLYQGGWYIDHALVMVANLSHLITIHEKGSVRSTFFGSHLYKTACIRHDAHFTRYSGGKVESGRIRFITDTVGEEATGPRIIGDMVSDAAKANDDTTVADETIQWRPQIKLPRPVTLSQAAGIALKSVPNGFPARPPNTESFVLASLPNCNSPVAWVPAFRNYGGSDTTYVPTTATANWKLDFKVNWTPQFTQSTSNDSAPTLRLAYMTVAEGATIPSTLTGTQSTQLEGTQNTLKTTTLTIPAADISSLAGVGGKVIWALYLIGLGESGAARPIFLHHVAVEVNWGS